MQKKETLLFVTFCDFFHVHNDFFFNLHHMESQLIKQKCRNKYLIAKAIVKLHLLHISFIPTPLLSTANPQVKSHVKALSYRVHSTSVQTAEKKQERETDHIMDSTREAEIC